MAEGEPTAGGPVVAESVESPDSTAAPAVPDIPPTTDKPTGEPTLPPRELAKLRKEWAKLKQQFDDVDKAGLTVPAEIAKAKAEILKTMNTFLAGTPPEFQNTVEDRVIPEVSDEHKQLVKDLINELRDRDYLAARLAEFRAEGRPARVNAVKQLEALLALSPTKDIRALDADTLASIEEQLRKETGDRETAQRRRAWLKVVGGVLGAAGSTALATTGIGTAASTMGFGASFSALTQGIIELRELQSAENSEQLRLEGQLAAWHNYATALELAERVQREGEQPAHVAELLNEVRAHDRAVFDTSTKWRKLATKTAWQKAGLGFTAGTATTIGGVLLAKKLLLEQLMQQGLSFDFDQIHPAHIVKKTKDTFVFLYKGAASSDWHSKALAKMGSAVGSSIKRAFMGTVEWQQLNARAALFGTIGMLANGLNFLSLRGRQRAGSELVDKQTAKERDRAALAFEQADKTQRANEKAREDRLEAERVAEAEQPFRTAAAGERYLLKVDIDGQPRTVQAEVIDDDDDERDLGRIKLRFTDPANITALKAGGYSFGPHSTFTLTKEQFNDPDQVEPLDPKHHHYSEAQREILRLRANELAELAKGGKVAHLNFVSEFAAAEVPKLHPGTEYRVSKVDETSNKVWLFDKKLGPQHTFDLTLTDLLNALELDETATTLTTPSFTRKPRPAHSSGVGADSPEVGADTLGMAGERDVNTYEVYDDAELLHEPAKAAESAAEAELRYQHAQAVHETIGDLNDERQAVDELIDRLDPADVELGEQLAQRHTELTRQLAALAEFDARQPDRSNFEFMPMPAGELRDLVLAWRTMPVTSVDDCITADRIVTSETRRVPLGLIDASGNEITHVWYELASDSYSMFGWPGFGDALMVPRDPMKQPTLRNIGQPERPLTADESQQTGDLRERLERAFWGAGDQLLIREVVSAEGLFASIQTTAWDADAEPIATLQLAEQGSDPSSATSKTFAIGLESGQISRRRRAGEPASQPLAADEPIQVLRDGYATDEIRQTRQAELDALNGGGGEGAA